jgi:hypothetical protein
VKVQESKVSIKQKEERERKREREREKEVFFKSIILIRFIALFVKGNDLQ